MLVRLPDGYSNMLELHKKSMRRPNIRFVGGYLLQVEGVNIGRYDKDLQSHDGVFLGAYDEFVEANLDELSDIKKVYSKVKKVVSSDSDKQEKKKEKKKVGSTLSTSFNRLFGDEDDDF